MRTTPQLIESRHLREFAGRFKRILPITLALLFLFPDISIAEDRTTKHDSLILIVPVLIIVVGLLTRVLLNRHMKGLMFSSSEDELDGTPELLSAEEVTARALPEFDIIDYTIDLPDALANRIKLEKVNRKELGRGLRYEVLIAAIYLVASSFMGDVNIAFWAATLPFLFISMIRYLAFRKPSRAYTGGVAGFLGPILHSFLTIAEPGMRMFWHSVVMLVIATVAAIQFSFGDIRNGVISLVAIILHLWLMSRLLSKSSQRQVFKLLVLRVFGIDDTMEFTFTGLLKYWRHFGPYFMVADPTLLKTQRNNNGVWVLVLAGALLLVPMLIDGNPTLTSMSALSLQLIAGAVVSLIAFVYFLIARNRITRQFVRSRDDLLNRVESLSKKPLNWNLNFRTLHLFCHDNTWRVAVAECMKTADTILMDLRGFSEERQGCKYEIDFLFDAVPAERIVFLVNHECLEMAQKTIIEKWRELRTVSPNLENAEPRISLYLTQRENRRDMQGLLDLLLSKASG